MRPQVWEVGYGKDNQVLHTAEFSETYEVDSSASRRKTDRVPFKDEVSLENSRSGRAFALLETA